MKRLLIILALVAASAAQAEVYTWTDDSGTMCFTEDPSTVPKKYRKKMKKLGEDEPAPAAAEPGPAGEGKAPEGETKGAGAGKKPAPGTAVYGGRTGAAWQEEFIQISNRLTKAKEDLGEKRNRFVNEGAALSREKYIELQGEVRRVEKEYGALYEEKQKLIQEADKAGVPDEFRW